MRSPDEDQPETAPSAEPATNADPDRRLLTKWSWLLQETGFSRRQAHHLIMVRLLYQMGRLRD